MTIGALCKKGSTKTVSASVRPKPPLVDGRYNWHKLCLYDGCKCECHGEGKQ